MGFLVALASLAGVAVLVWQVHSAQTSDLMRFFAEYNDRYDRTVSSIPLSVFLDNRPSKLDEFDSMGQRECVERAVYEYFALCEEELNLFGKRSSRKTTHRFGHRKSWDSVRVEWESGIKQNMRLSLFQDCWKRFEGRFLCISKINEAGITSVQFCKLRCFMQENGFVTSSDGSSCFGSSD